MTNQQTKQLIKKFGGWIDGEFIRFPTPYALAQFEKAAAAQTEGR